MDMSLFSYFGQKRYMAKTYPIPAYDTIIEPFAGGAGYATHYSYKNVILVEKDPVVAGVWDYLIHATPADILSLPIVPQGTTLDKFSLEPNAYNFVGYCIAQSSAYRRHKPSAWSSWNENRRERVANCVTKIKHWTVINGDYSEAPDIEATWFIDPPYMVEGRTYKFAKSYKYSGEGIDFEHLGAWCQSRKGQVMVCENEGANWLPFRPHKSTPAKKSKVDHREEVIWTNIKNGFFCGD